MRVAVVLTYVVAPALVGAVVSVSTATASGSNVAGVPQLQCAAGSAAQYTSYDYAAGADGANPTPQAALDSYRQSSNTAAPDSAYSPAPTSSGQSSSAGAVDYVRSSAGRTVEIVQVDAAGRGWLPTSVERCAAFEGSVAK